MKEKSKLSRRAKGNNEKHEEVWSTNNMPHMKMSLQRTQRK